MMPLRSLGIKMPSFLRNSFSSMSISGSGIDLPSVKIYDVEENAEKRARTLKHLLKANHINNSIIYNQLRFHNHCPHHLGAAYMLGATQDQLNAIWDDESKSLDPWEDSPGEISQEDWRDFLGKKEYQRAYVDFFEDRLVQHGYDWKDMLNEYLFSGEDPLINNVFCSLAHPVIHLAYAYELSSPTIAVEALAMEACFYNDFNKYFNDPSYTKPVEKPKTDLLEILSLVANDKRFDSLKVLNTADEGEMLAADPKLEEIMLEYWNSWDLSDPKKQFEESQRAATAVLLGTITDKSPKYDFFLLHSLTGSHAARVLLPLIPSKWHMSLVRQWWLFTLTAYVMQKRPAVDVSRITDYDLKGRDWTYVVHDALEGKHAHDPHYVKALRSMKVCSETWGDADQYYLKAAVRYADEFAGYQGFGGH